MKCFSDPREASAWSAERRAEGLCVGFVPTMGALHEGHLSLVRRSLKETDVTCVSIFVNPLQFDDPRDLERYPRDLAADGRALSECGVAMMFTGSLEQFFPEIDGARRADIPSADPGPAAQGLEGAVRKGHFEGVATIVARLFQLVRPQAAFFGEKDFQQTLVVRHVAAQMGAAERPRIVVVPTSREADGLARSSRNVRLTSAGRESAAALYRALGAARDAWHAGERNSGTIEALILRVVHEAGLEIEYAELRDAAAWRARRDECTSPDQAALGAAEPRAFIAARVDGVRLIDNMALSNACT